MALAGKKRPRKILSPMDFGDAATRRKYCRSGLVITYRKGEIPTEANISFEEFMKIEDKTEAQNVLKQLVANNSDSRLAEHWGIPLHRVKTLRNDLGLIKDRKGDLIEIREPEKWGATKRTRKRTKKPAETQENEKLLSIVPDNEFQVMLTGVFSVDELGDRLEALRAMLPSVSGKFFTEIRLRETKCTP